MKKILFCCYGLGLGGIEKCLTNLLNILPEDKYDVDVLLMNPIYDLKDEIRRNVNWINSFVYVMNTTDTMQKIKEHGGIRKNISIFLRYCAFRVLVKLRLKPWKVFKPIEQKYDIAIAYSQNDFSPYYVIDRVKASKKLLWYHNGAYEGNARQYQRDNDYYLKFDHVIAVSDDCAKMLRTKFKFRNGQLQILHNVCDAQNIMSRSGEGIPQGFENDKIHIVTVGRLTKEKGANIAVDVCKKLCDAGLSVRWHWVGDGNQHDTILQKIMQLHMDDNFILEGNQSNPYPFIKNADIYVQPSYYEAYSTTVTEARVLRRPIVVTDVGGMRDQIEDGVNGIIDPISVADIYESIKELIEHKETRQKLVDTLSKQSWEGNTFLQAYEHTVLK